MLKEANDSFYSFLIIKEIYQFFILTFSVRIINKPQKMLGKLEVIFTYEMNYL